MPDRLQSFTMSRDDAANAAVCPLQSRQLPDEVGAHEMRLRVLVAEQLVGLRLVGPDAERCRRRCAGCARRRSALSYSPIVS